MFLRGGKNAQRQEWAEAVRAGWRDIASRAEEQETEDRARVKESSGSTTHGSSASSQTPGSQNAREIYFCVFQLTNLSKVIFTAMRDQYY